MTHLAEKAEKRIVLRTGEEYIESLRDGWDVRIDGEQVTGLPPHPAFAPIMGGYAPGSTNLAGETSPRARTDYEEEEESAERPAPATTRRPSGHQSTQSSTKPATCSPASAARPSARCGHCAEPESRCGGR